MQQLTGMDATFLHMETPSTQGHVGSLTIFDAETAPPHFGFEEIKASSRSGCISRHRCGAGWSRCRSASTSRTGSRIRTSTSTSTSGRSPCRRPATSASSPDQVARLHERPLDRSHPLWELYVIWGLADGHVAQYTKIHHSAIDGVSGAELLAVLLDLEAEPRKVDPPERAVGARSRAVARSTCCAAASCPLAHPAAQGVALPAAHVAGDGSAGPRQPGARRPPARHRQPRRGRSGRRRPGGHQPAAQAEERGGRGDRAADAARAADDLQPHHHAPSHASSFGSLSLDTAKEVKNAFGVTVNDVILAVCGGALRRYLERAGRAARRVAARHGPGLGAHRGAEGGDGQPGVGHDRHPRPPTRPTRSRGCAPSTRRCRSPSSSTRRSRPTSSRTTRQFATPALAAAGGASGRPHQDRRPRQRAVQRHDLQHPRPELPALRRRRPAGRQLSGLGHRRRDRASTSP